MALSAGAPTSDDARWRLGDDADVRIVLWAAVAVVQVIVLVGYVAFSSYREPPVELWGTLIKVTQAVILVAVIYLIARARQAAATSVPSPTVPKGHAA
jgi:hypothetical protein